MTKTNKEFRSDLAQEMRDKFDKRNEELDRIEKSPYSEGLREQMRKELMDNFYAEIDEMKKRPGYEEARKTHLEEIKAKSGVRKAKTAKEKLLKEYEEMLAKADADISDSKKSYEDAQIAYRGKVEDEQTNSESWAQGPIQELENLRFNWEHRIQGINSTTKEKIIKVAEKIPVKIETYDRNSRLIKFKLGREIYSIFINPFLMMRSDSEYMGENGVIAKGMQGDDVEKWENKKLKKYVKKIQGEWIQGEGLHIAKIEEIKKLLKGLGKKARLDNESDQMAMLMYLTGMEGDYWLSMGDNEKSNSQASSRYKLQCNYDSRQLLCSDNDYANAKLCMIKCN